LIYVVVIDACVRLARSIMSAKEGSRSDRSVANSSARSSFAGSEPASPAGKRQEPKATVFHSSGKVQIVPLELLDGTPAWNDRHYTYLDPQYGLLGAVLFACPYKKVKSGYYRLTPRVAGRAYIWCNPKSDRHGGVADLGWRGEDFDISLAHEQEFDDTPDHPFRSFKVYSRGLKAGESIDIQITCSWVGGLAFAEATDKCSQANCGFAPSRSGGTGFCCSSCQKTPGRHGNKCRQRPSVLAAEDDALGGQPQQSASSSKKQASAASAAASSSAAVAVAPVALEQRGGASASSSHPAGPTTAVAAGRQRASGDDSGATVALDEDAPVDRAALKAGLQGLARHDEDPGAGVGFLEVAAVAPRRGQVGTMTAAEIHQELLDECTTPLQRAALTKLNIWEVGDCDYSLDQVMDFSSWLEAKLLPPPVKPIRFPSASRQAACLVVALLMLGMVCFLTALTVSIKRPAAVDAQGILRPAASVDGVAYAGEVVNLHGLRDWPDLPEEELRKAQDVVLRDRGGSFHYYRVASVTRPMGGDGLRVVAEDGTIIVVEGEIAIVRRPWEHEVVVDLSSGEATWGTAGTFKSLAALANASSGKGLEKVKASSAGFQTERVTAAAAGDR